MNEKEWMEALGRISIVSHILRENRKRGIKDGESPPIPTTPRTGKCMDCGEPCTASSKRCMKCSRKAPKHVAGSSKVTLEPFTPTVMP